MILKIEETLNCRLRQKIRRGQDPFLHMKRMKFKSFKEVKVFKFNHFKILTKHKEQKLT